METTAKTTIKTKSNNKEKPQNQQLTTSGRVGAREGIAQTHKGGTIINTTKKKKLTKISRIKQKTKTHNNYKNNEKTLTTAKFVLPAITTFITILTLLTLITPLTHADTSLGSTTTIKDILLSPGQQKIIEVTFFNTGSTDIDLLIEQITPVEKTSQVSDVKAYIMQKNRNILVVNQALTLKSMPATKTPKKDPDTTWIVLGEKGDLYIPAKKVSFLIKVPDKQTYAKNKYTLIFRASTQNTGTIKDSTTASIGQIREFPVTVTIQKIVPNPQSADETSPQARAKKTYTPLTKSTTSLPEPANNQEQPDTNDNYINNNYIPKDDTTINNPAAGTKNIGSTQDTNTTISNTETQNTGTKDQITGLATGNTSPPKTPYNILTIIIMLIGTFTLYRIARH